MSNLESFDHFTQGLAHNLKVFIDQILFDDSSENMPDISIDQTKQLRDSIYSSIYHRHKKNLVKNIKYLFTEIICERAKDSGDPSIERKIRNLKYESFFLLDEIQKVFGGDTFSYNLEQLLWDDGPENLRERAIELQELNRVLYQKSNKSFP